MTKFRNLKLRAKLMVFSSISVLFLLFIGLISGYSMNVMSHKAKDMYADRLLPVKWLNQMKTNFYGSEADLLEIMITKDANENMRLVTDYRNRSEENTTLLEQFSKIHMTAVEVELFEQLTKEADQYGSLRNQIVELGLKNKNEEAYSLYVKDLSAVKAQVVKSINKLIEISESEAEALSVEVETSSTRISVVMLLSIVVAVILLMGTARLINVLITKPIQALQQRMERAAEGDLTAFGDYLYKDEAGQLTAHYNSMLEALRSLVERINDNALTLSASSEELLAGAEQSSTAAQEVAVSSQHLAEEFEQQTDSVSKANLAVTQMSASIDQIEQSSEEVSRLANEAASNSQVGMQSVSMISGQMEIIADVVAETQTTINELNQRADQIGSILVVINDIASQTNLLSLNAGIEAARAGEMGRGFAVVAEEVRKLATQSSDSAKDISQLIRFIQKEITQAVGSMKRGAEQVEQGLRMTTETKETFGQIERSVSDVTLKLNEVNSSIIDLTTGSQQIVQMMDAVSSVAHTGLSISQQTAAASEEQHATSEEIENSAKSLAVLAEELQMSLKKFTV